MPASDFPGTLDLRKIEERLHATTFGDMVEYHEISVLIGRDVQDDPKAYAIMHRARERLLDEFQIVFETIRDVGLKRLNDVEKIYAGAGSLPRIYRESKRGAKKIAAADFSALPDHEKKRANAFAATLGLHAHLASPKQLAKIRQTSHASKQPSFPQLLRALLDEPATKSS